MVQVGERLRTRDVQRLETRERVFECALAEFGRTGTADADVGAIVKAAGVARGTFYFHFPSKEHVLAELEQREQQRLAGELERFLQREHSLPEVLREIVRLVVALDRRLGSVLFRDVLALHFSPTRPTSDQWTENAFIVRVVEEIGRAHRCGEVSPRTDPEHTAFFFLMGLYALLSTSHELKRAERVAMLENFVQTVLSGLEPR